MKKLLLNILFLAVVFFSANAVMACGPDCDCGCQKGQECTCDKVETKVSNDCGCKTKKSKCDCGEEKCTCDKCACKERKFLFIKKKCNCQE